MQKENIKLLHFGAAVLVADQNFKKYFGFYDGR